MEGVKSPFQGIAGGDGCVYICKVNEIQVDFFST